MTTKEILIANVAADNPNIARDDIKDAVSLILEHMQSELIAGNKVEIRGFGSFHVKDISLPKHSYALARKDTTKTLRYSMSDNLLRKINDVY